MLKPEFSKLPSHASAMSQGGKIKTTLTSDNEMDMPPATESDVSDNTVFEVARMALGDDSCFFAGGFAGRRSLAFAMLFNLSEQIKKPVHRLPVLSRLCRVEEVFKVLYIRLNA
ncbi:MAG: hypothetical protein JWN98_2238 [Abditibacteriota bacterium]|nr:hypothetical protein [Abditibacteriota bacterium]